LIAAAVLVVAAGLGAGGWVLATRTTGHRALASAERRPVHPRPAPRPTVMGLTFASNSVNPHFSNPPAAGALFDLWSGRTLWKVDTYRRLPIASLTKVLTAIIVTDRTKPGDLAPVTNEALNYSRQGQALGELPPHRRVPVEALLSAMIVTSAEDAAIDLADYISGSDAHFAQLMNATGQDLGLRCSHFVSSDGIEPANQSCIADLGALTRIAMSRPRIARYAGEEQAKAPFPIRGGYLFVTTTNPLLLSGYPGTIGLKTGFTTRAGRCLIAVVTRRHRTLAAVLLDSPNPAMQAEKLFGAAFASGQAQKATR
jgi:serine-type D-Ala-D-Ala carboxypeptidase (penicillin-binding protein 5/6)